MAKPTANNFIIPLIPEKTIEERMAHFPANIYNIEEGSHLRALVEAICGDAGAGDLRKKLLLTRFQQTLAVTHFFDLDKLFGNPLRFARISSEIYPYNPYEDFLTTDEWDEIKVKDATYRGRVQRYLKGLVFGTTKKGLKMVAEAAIGVPVDILENYEYLDGGVDTTGQTFGRLDTNSREEITIVPSKATVTQTEERRILHAVDRVRLANRIYTVSSKGIPVHTELNIGAAASSEYVQVQKTVTVENDWPFEARGKSWIVAGDTQEMRYRAFLEHQNWATEFVLDVRDTVASSVKVGKFNSAQTSLFRHLPTNISDDYIWSPNAALRDNYRYVKTPTLFEEPRREAI